jgi:hypothetical protein
MKRKLSKFTRWGILLLTVTCVSIACDDQHATENKNAKTREIEVSKGSCVVYTTVPDATGTTTIVDTFTPALLDNFYGEFYEMRNFWRLPNVTLWFYSDLSNTAMQSNASSFGAPYYLIAMGQTTYLEKKALAGLHAGPVGVLGHEFGHQVQYAYNIQTGATDPLMPVRFKELQADGLATFYLSRGRRLPWSSITPFCDYTLPSMGDYVFSDPQHHGTPAQRRSAGRLGFLIAQQTSVTTVADVDALFRYYYNHVLLADSFFNGRKEKPEILIQHPEIEAFMDSKIEELRKIASGKITGDDYTNLQ